MYSKHKVKIFLLILVVFANCRGKNFSSDAAVDADPSTPTEVENKTFIMIDPLIVDTDVFKEPELPGDLCRPCETNHDCKGGGGLCMMNLVRNETFCSICCGWTECPDGFVCMPTNIFKPEPETFQCMPKNAEIPCKSNYEENLNDK